VSVFDRRHKWGEVVREGIYITRTCRVCGRTDRYETLIPDAFIEPVTGPLTTPNPYRDLFR